MIPRNPRRAAAIVLAALMFGGCATKGYVNDRIAEIDGKQTQELDRVRETASGAREAGDAAARSAMEARDLALGDVEWREVDRATVRFAFDSAELSGDARAELARVSGTIANSRRARVDIYGYTDTIGSDEYNDRLSARRADAVLRHLLGASRAPLTRFTIVGMGESAPVGEGETEDHEAGRRVVVSVLEARQPEGAAGETQLSRADAERGGRR
jgi:outer membrane protein OmpA-like peptidoglycan-associated protein